MPVLKTIADEGSLSRYSSQPGIDGTIISVGSDTMANLMALWADGFQRYYPHVTFQIQATGSSTASQAITQGTASIGPMSRAFTKAELARFEQVHGYAPTSLVVAIDAIGIYVERNNPLNQITLQQVDAVFSSTRFCGAPDAIRHWPELGVEKFHTERRIEIFSRSSISGTYDLFKQFALCGGDFALHNNEMPSSSSVIQSVASSIGGIGYAALGQDNRDVKAIAISIDGQEYFAPTDSNIESGRYPFSRYLYITVNKAPNRDLPRLEFAFLSFILSEQGQSIVRSTGYFPINPTLVERQLRLIKK